MWMQALLLMPYLVLASSAALVVVIVSICWTQAVARQPSFAAARQLERRARDSTGRTDFREHRRFVRPQPVLPARRSRA
jgi:hypothetical protein